MIIGNNLNYDLSGFYDNGGEYVIHLVFKNNGDMDKANNVITKNIKNNYFKKTIIENDSKIILKTNDLKYCFQFLKKNLINLTLETL